MSKAEIQSEECGMAVQERSANISAGVVKDWLKITQIYFQLLYPLGYNTITVGLMNSNHNGIFRNYA